MSCDNILSLIDWRFEMAALYQRVSSSDSLKDIWPSFIVERKRLYKTHKQSPLQRGDSIAFFDYDPAFSIEVSLKPLPVVNSRTVGGGKDGLIHLNAVAITSGLAPSLGGELTIYQLAHYGGGLFLPFSDDTNGRSSYGGAVSYTHLRAHET